MVHYSVAGLMNCNITAGTFFIGDQLIFLVYQLVILLGQASDLFMPTVLVVIYSCQVHSYLIQCRKEVHDYDNNEE